MHCHSLFQGIFLTRIDLTAPVLAGGPFTTESPGKLDIGPQRVTNAPYKGQVLVAQWCPTLYDPTDCSPPGFSVHGILQARILKWVAILFSKGIFPTWGSNPGLLYCRQILYCLTYQGSPLQRQDVDNREDVGVSSRGTLSASFIVIT